MLELTNAETVIVVQLRLKGHEPDLGVRAATRPANNIYAECRRCGIVFAVSGRAERRQAYGTINHCSRHRYV